MIHDKNLLNDGMNIWLIILYILNLLDLVISCIGLKLGCIEEANPFMSALYDLNPYIFGLWKIAIPIILTVIISKLMRFCTETIIIKVLILSVVCIYVVVLFIHVRWALYFL